VNVLSSEIVMAKIQRGCLVHNAAANFSYSCTRPAS
jgi:hypothetical protein